MTIRVRFAFLLGLFLAALVLTVLALRWMERDERERMLAAERQNRALMLNHWVDFTSRALPGLTSDLVQSEELTSTPATNPALRQKLQTFVTSANLTGAWIVGNDGSIL